MTAQDEESPESGPVLAMTTAMLKAVANPLRREVLALFRAQEKWRAADVAAALGQPANKISFHLRVLADAGLIVDAPELARDRRDRVWVARKGSLELGRPGRPVADEALGQVFLHATLEEHAERVRRLAAWAPEYVTGRATQGHGTFTSSTLRLTVPEFEALMEEVHRAIAAATARHDAAAADEHVYELDIFAVNETI